MTDFHTYRCDEARGQYNFRYFPKKMTIKCSLFTLPTWAHFYKEISRELDKSRLWMNHHEAVDFTVFEFGKRTVFLQSRLCLFTLTLISTCYVYPSILLINPGISPAAPFVYMHTWLFTLLTCHQMFEIIALVYCYYKVPTCVLAKFVGYFHMMCQVILTVAVGANVCVVATPSRFTHVYQPLGLTLVHILFSYVFQKCGLTNADGQNYVYKHLDWNNRFTALVIAVLWMLLTLCCHTLCVITCWSRRVVFRTHRKKTKPVYGIDVNDYNVFESDSVHCPQHWKTSKHRCCYKGCLSPDSVNDTPYLMLNYDPHQSYRDAEASTRGSPEAAKASGGDMCSGEVPKGGHVTLEARRLSRPRTALTFFIGGSIPESSQSEQCHTSVNVNPSGVDEGVDPSNNNLGQKKLKRCLRALRRKRRQRRLKVKQWSMKKYVGVKEAPDASDRQDFLATPLDELDVERQMEDRGSWERRKRSSDSDVSVDEDVESEDNDEDLDDEVNESSSDSVFLK
ncbi:uncharacterized protein LOC129928710 isoform X3 [Biomphalaria glabrata]|uniref:Uncharacterized protein LOC129928710 isoform X3 n=1 Tax=Biomphalaria glabrata TaxID=6526 RepID=A0A9W3BL18_BIOGL|nr:uncharacterized protein LOC129928710 isoform X3 [Biomphalaria glabrata]